MKADKTDFTAPNFGNVSVFNLHSHVDHRAAKRRIAHAVGRIESIPFYFNHNRLLTKAWKSVFHEKYANL
jgi:hypothetical protein